GQPALLQALGGRGKKVAMRCWELNTQQAEAWRDVLAHFPEADVYFLPEYHRLYEINGDGSACAFMAGEEGAIFFYTFFPRPISKVGAQVLPEAWYDIETVVGYTGPLCTPGAAFLRRVWEAFADWCTRNRVIAEFVRFNPFLDNYRCVDDAYRVVSD